MTTHRVKESDKHRIKCMNCGNPADVCEHSEWNTGNTKGVSFWYYCDNHAPHPVFHNDQEISVAFPNTPGNRMI